MELMPGYKQTEVGVIPEEWVASRLQDACGEPITYGIVQCGPHLPNGIPYVRVSDMDKPELDVEGMLRTAPAIAARFSRSTVAEGDLIYALRGKLGEVRRVQSSVAGANLTQGTARLSPRKEIVGDYLMWAMRNSRVMRQAEVEAKGTTFREITLADLRRICIPIPEVIEQRAIANSLSDMDALLAGLDRLTAKKRDLKQAAMQQLLTGQTRLPGFQGEWVVKSLGELCSLKSGQAITAENIDDHALYRCFGGNGLRGRTRTYTHEGAYALVGRQGALCGNVVGVEGKFFASEHALVVTARPAVSIAWLTFVLGRMNLNQYSESSAQPGLSAAKLLLLDVPTPPSTVEQSGIAAVLSDMDAELTALEARRDKTRALKQAMMQELLTGKTRLV